jgi:hypothetical protein
MPHGVAGRRRGAGTGSIAAFPDAEPVRVNQDDPCAPREADGCRRNTGGCRRNTGGGRRNTGGPPATPATGSGA